MSEIYLPITTITASLLAVWLVVLSARVIKARRAGRVAFGDGEDDLLKISIRAHGNLAEYGPFFLILLGLLEVQGGNAWIVGALAAVFLVGRFVHGYAFAFAGGNMKGRVRGMILTIVSLNAAALYALVLVVF